jgi:hypothetical protein
MKNARDHLLGALLTGFLIGPGCSLGSKEPAVFDTKITTPRTVPSIVGQITAIALPVITVEEQPAEPHGSAKAHVRITTETQWLRRGEVGSGIAELQVGQQVRIWFKGPVMESYPLQATAGVIYLEPKN